MEKITQDFSKKLIQQFHNNFVDSSIDNDEYFQSISLIIKGIEQFCKDNKFNVSIIEKIKKELLNFTFNLFKNYWLFQAKQSAEEDEDFNFNEDEEIEECRETFYDWFES